MNILAKIINNYTYEDANAGNLFYKFFKNLFLTFRFMIRNLKYPKFLFFYLINFRDKDFIFNLKSFTEIEFLENAKNGKSLIRFGDGEIALMREIDIHFQKSEKSLSQTLWQIVNSYNNESSFMLTLNNFMLAKPNSILKEKGLLRMWLPMKVMYNIYFNKEQKYADTEMFYYKGFFRDKILPIIQNKNMIIISKKENIEKIQNSELSKQYKIFYIISKSTNAYFEKDIIKKQIDSVIRDLNDNQIVNEQIVLLPACGPLSKVLAFEYLSSNTQTLDMGHGIEIAFTNEDYSEKTLRI